MVDTIRNTATDLIFFTRVVAGRAYGAWYRVLPAHCIEILAVGLMQTIPLDGRRPEEVAGGALEEFVRTRQKLGQPVPTIEPPTSTATKGTSD
jgi:hypothetical protein